MKNTSRIWLLAVIVMGVPVIAHAQIGGCVDSPENPTAILVLVGAAAYALPTLRQKLRGIRRK